jgi:hypothetical protein
VIFEDRDRVNAALTALADAAVAARR